MKYVVFNSSNTVYLSLTVMPSDPAMMTEVAMSRNIPWSYANNNSLVFNRHCSCQTLTASTMMYVLLNSSSHCDWQCSDTVYLSLTVMPSDPAMMTEVAMSRNSPWSTTPSSARMAELAALASAILAPFCIMKKDKLFVCAWRRIGSSSHIRDVYQACRG